MSLIDSLGNSVMKRRLRQIEKTINNPHEVQQAVLMDLLKKARGTVYGKKYGFGDIKTLRQFQEQVPIVSYEDLVPYIDRLLKGEQNILWPSIIKWFAKSSGTTGASSKLIPVSEEGLRN